MKTKAILNLMAVKIKAIAKMDVEVNVLSGNGNRGAIITIIIDGANEETSEAAKRIAEAAGDKFEDGGYDAECGCYFCGIKE